MESKQTCQTCKHFYQHYVKVSEDYYFQCGSGHCVYPRSKLRYNDTKACQNYVPTETAGNAPPSDFTR